MRARWLLLRQLRHCVLPQLQLPYYHTVTSARFPCVLYRTYRQLAPSRYQSVKTPWLTYTQHRTYGFEFAKLISNAFGLNEIEVDAEIQKQGMSIQSRESLVESLLILKEYNVVLNSPSQISCLSHRPDIIYHRLLALGELGFTKISPEHIEEYNNIMSLTVQGLQQLGVIPPNVTDPMRHIVERLLSGHPEIVNVVLSQSARLASLPLIDIRRHLLFIYLNRRAGVTHRHMDDILKTYQSVNNRSIVDIVECVEIIINSFHMPPEKFRTHGFLLMTTPTNLRRLLEKCPSLGGEPIHVLARKCPKIINMPAENVFRTNEILQKFGVTDEQILKVPQIYLLHPNTVETRLKELHSIPELEVMKTSPRLLYLVYSMNIAKHRLKFLQSQGCQTLSLDLLTTNTLIFSRSTTLGSTSRSYQCKETIRMLSEYFNKPEEIIRHQLFKHPQARKVPTLTVRDSLNFLCDRGFSSEQIFNGIQVLLYQRSVIERHLATLPDIPGVGDWSEWEGHSNILQLLLYGIELKYNLECRGVWEDTQFPETRPHLNNQDLSTRLNFKRESRRKQIPRGNDYTLPDVYIRNQK